MKALMATPYIPITKMMSSHRAAQAAIYAQQLKEAGVDVTVNMSMDLYHEDFNEFDELYVYHGNDWRGILNIFGGFDNFPYAQNFVNFCKFKGKVYSLAIPFPNYHKQTRHKMGLFEARGVTIKPEWYQVDWDNLLRMESEATIVDPNALKTYPNIATGDSHAICMYRPGWNVNSVPFKTLHGALKQRLDSFLSQASRWENVEFYFGNIDVRHHLMRQEDPEGATRDLVRRYFEQAREIADKYNANVKVYELLPIENESRTIPKTGWYEGTPFFGSWEDRNELRLIFKDECKRREDDRVHLYEWVAGMINLAGELDFKYMEKPKSVHLSREYYPHWQGWEWNGFTEPQTDYKPVARVATLEDFF